MTHTIHLQAVDSRYASDDELAEAGLTPEQYPDGWRVLAHQARTMRALRFGDAPIVVNTAMTGDGKSLAGQLQLFNNMDQRTFTMYPTNELAVDQERSLEGLMREWKPPAWTAKALRRVVINAEALDAKQGATDDPPLSRPEALDLLLENEYVLTNPDIFHYVMTFGYREYGQARDHVLGRLAQRYRLFVFDEFHLFGIAQTASVMMALLLLKRMSRERHPLRFLFLSATPQNALQGMAQALNLPVETIEGAYQHGQPATPRDHRRILQPVTLTLHTGSLEEWCDAHTSDVLLRFFAEHRPGAKGVIIANSVATAHRIYDRLKPQLGAVGLSVEINTGLTPKDKRGRIFDLLVATSTVDVGVDFRINLLIFESTDAATHLQRLGRLGRHEEDTHGNRFGGHFEAHALVPPWVEEALREKFKADSSINRSNYRQEIESAFPSQQEFKQYPTRWSGVQAGYILDHLRKPEIKAQYAHIYDPIKADYMTLFGKSIYKYLDLKRDKGATFDAAVSFRGGSPFTALVTGGEAGQADAVMSYNLMTLLTHADLEPVSLNEMYRRAQRFGQSRKSLERTQPLAAYHRRGWLDRPRQISVVYDDDLDATQRESVIEMRGFRLEVSDGFPGLRDLNDAVEARTLTAFLIPHKDPDLVRRICKLGYLFPLLRLQVEGGVGSAAFGRDALLLSTVWYPKRSSADAPFIL